MSDTSYMSPEDYATKWKLHPESVRKWLRLNILAGRKFGRVWRVHVDARPKS